MRVCVYGSAAKGTAERTFAHAVGRLIAEGGHSLTYGGFGDGVLVLS